MKFLTSVLVFVLAIAANNVSILNAQDIDIEAPAEIPFELESNEVF